MRIFPLSFAILCHLTSTELILTCNRPKYTNSERGRRRRRTSARKVSLVPISPLQLVSDV